MTNIDERFQALPRVTIDGRVMILAPEAELRELIGDVQASEAELVRPRDIGEGRFDDVARPPVDTEINISQGWVAKPLDQHVPGQLNLEPRRHAPWSGAYRPPGM